MGLRTRRDKQRKKRRFRLKARVPSVREALSLSPSLPLYPPLVLRVALSMQLLFPQSVCSSLSLGSPVVSSDRLSRLMLFCVLDDCFTQPNEVTRLIY